MSPSNSNKASVVLVGAGDSARYILEMLQRPKKSRSNMVITLIRSNDFSEVNYYSTYALTRQGEYDANATTTPPAGADKVVDGKAVQMKDGMLYVRSLSENENMITVTFDIIIAATGSTIPLIQPAPGQSLSDRKTQVELFLRAISMATKSDEGNIIVEGGGTVGVELAGDLLEAITQQLPTGMTTNHIIIVSRNDRLVADQSPSISAKVQDYLRVMGARIIYENEVVSHSGTKIVSENEKPFEVVLKDGEIIPCFALISAFGNGPNTQWIQGDTDDKTGQNIPDNILDAKKRVIVNSYLQSVAYPKLYAIGAVSTLDETLIVPNIQQQATSIAHNVSAVLTNQAQKDHVDSPLKSESPLYLKIGHEKNVTLILENLPSPVATVLFRWCGFPCNFLAPCFCLSVICGVCDPMLCGWCCDDGNSEISKKALAKTMLNMKKKNILAARSGYSDLGSTEHLREQKMLR